MLRAIIKKEWIHHLASFRFHVSAAIAVALAILAALVGVESYELRLAEYQTSQERHANVAKGVLVYSQLQPEIERPPEPLSVIDRGLEARLGRELRLSIYEIPVEATGEEEGGNPFMVSFRDFDSTSVVRLVLGLLALLLTFDAIVGERDDGNLKLTLAGSVVRTTVLLGKYCGALAAVLCPLALSMALTLWIMVGRGPIDLAPFQWRRVAAILLVYVLYLSVMVGLGLVLSLWARSTSSALVLSLLAWLVIVVLIPPVATAVAIELRGRHLDSRDVQERIGNLGEEFKNKIRDLRRQEPLLSDRLEKAPFVQRGLNQSVLLRLGSEPHYEAMARFYRQQTALGMSYAHKIFIERQEMASELRGVGSLADALSLPSPAFLLERLVESLAGTSTEDYEAFLVSSRDYRARLIGYLESQDAFDSWRWFTDEQEARSWVSRLELSPAELETLNEQQLPDLYLGSGLRQQAIEQHRRLVEDEDHWLKLDGLPAYAPPRPEFGEVLRRIRLELGLMMVLQIGLAGIVWAGFRRYGVG